MELYEFDDVISEIGGFGKWNVILLILSLFSAVVASFSHLSIVYLAYPPAFRCVGYDIGYNSTCRIGDGLHDHFDGFKNNYHHGHNHADDSDEDENDDDENENGGFKCEEFDFDQSDFPNTVVTEFKLVCDRKTLLPLLTSSYMAGILIANFSTGSLSDFFGRKKLAIICSALHIIATWVAWFSPDYWTFLFSRMVLGGSVHTLWSTLFLLIQETTQKDKRTFTSGMMSITWPVTQIGLAGIAYLVRDWRNLQLTFAISSLSFVSYFLFLLESPRWLLDVGRTEEAKAVMRTIAKRNGWPVDVDRLDQIIYHINKDKPGNVDVDQHKKTIKDRVMNIINTVLALVSTSTMRKRMFLLLPVMLSVGMASYGIHFAARFASDNMFMFVAIKSSVSVGWQVILMVVFDRMSRTKGLGFFYILSGICCVAFILVPNGVPEIKTGLMIVGQALIVGCYFMVDTYTPELLPTTVRNSGFNLLESVSKLGSAVAPFVVDLGGEQDPGIPPLIFGIFLIISSASFLFLPDTKSDNLPPTIEYIQENPGKPIIDLSECKDCISGVASGEVQI